MTDIEIRKQIIDASVTLRGDELKQTVNELLDSFPLSSLKLIKDGDREVISDSNWEVVLQLAKDSDMRKLHSLNQNRSACGLTPENGFGRHMA